MIQKTTGFNKRQASEMLTIIHLLQIATNARLSSRIDIYYLFLKTYKNEHWHRLNQITKE
jgi:hypothetical protein